MTSGSVYVSNESSVVAASSCVETFRQGFTGNGNSEPILRSRELSAIYSFVRGMPVWVADDYKQCLTEQLNRLDATKCKLQDAKRKLQEEIQQIEERERRLVEG